MNKEIAKAALQVEQDLLNLRGELNEKECKLLKEHGWEQKMIPAMEDWAWCQVIDDREIATTQEMAIAMLYAKAQASLLLPDEEVARELPCEEGEYCLATEYPDGEPGDHWAVGFFKGITAEHYDPPRYDVANSDGKLFRANGFRRVEPISKELGDWLLGHKDYVEAFEGSIWDLVGSLTMPLSSLGCSGHQIRPGNE